MQSENKPQGKKCFLGDLPRLSSTLWWFISALLLPWFARNCDLVIAKTVMQNFVKRVREFRANWCGMEISCNGLVGNHHWCQMCISVCLLGTMWKRVPEGAVADTYTTSPSLSNPTSPSTPAVKPTRPLLLPLPNPTLFQHRREDNVKQTSVWSITRACLPTCTPQETPFRLAD